MFLFIKRENFKIWKVVKKGMFYFTFTLLKLIFDYKNKKNPHFFLRISCDLHLQSGDFGYEDVECLS